MSRKTNIFNDQVFYKFVYIETYGDIEIVEKEFINYLELSSFKFKILNVLYNNEYSQEQLSEFNYKKKFSGFQSIRKQFKEDSIICVSKKEHKKEWYELTPTGIDLLKSEINKFISNNQYIKEHKKKTRQDKFKSSDESTKNKKLMRSFIEYILLEDDVRIRIMKNDFTFNLMDLAIFDIELSDFLLSDFSNAITLMETILTEEVDYKNKENVRGNIIIKGLDTMKSQYMRISEIQVADGKEYIHTKGLMIYKQSKIKEEVVSIIYSCNNDLCPYNEDYLTIGTPLKSCPKCKSSLSLLEEIKKDLLYIDIKDTESENSIKIKVYNGLIKQFQNVRVGEELDVFGHIELIKDTDNKDNKVLYNKVLVLNHFKQNSNVSQLTSDELITIEKKYNKLKDKNKIRNFLLKDFEKNFPYPKELFDLIIIPQLLKYEKGVENIIHPLFCGSPDCGKSTVLETMSLIFPKSSQIQLKNLSAAKFYGTVTKDGLSDLGLVMTLRDGTLILDELDKDEDSLNKSSEMLNEVLEGQKANKQKAGINVCLQNLNLRVYSIMNPDPTHRLDFIDWIKKNVHISTITRFFVVNFDYFMKDKDFEFIIRNSAKNGLKVFNNYDFKSRSDLILYLRNLEVDLSNIENDLIKFMFEIRKLTLDNEAASRNIKQIKNIITGLCRLNGVEVATTKELKEAINIVVWVFKTQGLSLDQYAQKLKEPTKQEMTIEVKV